MANTFTMKDGRKVTVDFTNTKSCLSVSRPDWKEISQKLREELDWVHSDRFTKDILNNLLGYRYSICK